MIPLEVKERFILLRAQGMSFEKIAKDLGKAKQTLVTWAREFEDEIANAKAIELDALLDQFFLTKQKRLESLGRMLSALQDELVSRNLSEIPTDKLLDLYLKFHAAAQIEVIEPKFKSEDEILEDKTDRAALDALVTGRRRLKKPQIA